MKIISHRGNLYGPASCKENHPDAIKAAIKKGFYVEIDCWFENEEFILGHDKPEYEVDFNFLFHNRKRLYCHAKSFKSAHWLDSCVGTKWFSHDKDLFAKINGTRNEFWGFPEIIREPSSFKCIVVDLNCKAAIDNAYGICTDFPVELKKNL